MEKIDVVCEHFSLPAKTNRLIQDCREAGDEICSRANGRGSIPQFEPADGRVCWNLLNSVVRQNLIHSKATDCKATIRKPVFCEWGSGLGLVTLIAATIGMTATGIEIEEELVDSARDFSKKFSIPVSFINASIYPEDNLIPIIDYKEVDLFFAYPWPNQITRMIELFGKVAVNGAVLVCYHGGQNYRVLRSTSVY